MKCNKELLSACVDGMLDEKGIKTVEEHCASCPACANEKALLEAFKKEAAALPKEPAPAGFLQSVRAAIEDEGSAAKAPRSIFKRYFTWELVGLAATLFLVVLTFDWRSGVSSRNYVPAEAVKRNAIMSDIQAPEASVPEEAVSALPQKAGSLAKSRDSVSAPAQPQADSPVKKTAAASELLTKADQVTDGMEKSQAEAAYGTAALKQEEVSLEFIFQPKQQSIERAATALASPARAVRAGMDESSLQKRYAALRTAPAPDLREEESAAVPPLDPAIVNAAAQIRLIVYRDCGGKILSENLSARRILAEIPASMYGVFSAKMEQAGIITPAFPKKPFSSADTCRFKITLESPVK